MTRCESYDLVGYLYGSLNTYSKPVNKKFSLKFILFERFCVLRIAFVEFELYHVCFESLKEHPVLKRRPNIFYECFQGF